MSIRLCKIALLAATGFFLLLVVFNNLTDYGSNYGFVYHVLAMDTTFPGNKGLWRAINFPPVYHLFYAIIILWESLACALCFGGAWKLWRYRHTLSPEFNRAKSLGVIGLTVSLLQWLVAFMAVGGEWFLMWQSKIWNGQDAAFRMFACIALILLFLVQKDEDLR